MLKITKTIGFFLLLGLMLSACVGIPSTKSLILSTHTVSNEMINAFRISALRCEFPDVSIDRYSSGDAIVYATAKARPSNVGITFLEYVHKSEVIIVEEDRNRNINDGFSETDLKKFLCFEDRLQKKLPDDFEWTVYKR